MITADEKVVREYLLGNLTEVESEKFERDFLGDNDLFEQLQGVEQDLMEDYARGRLNSLENEKFEGFFLRSRGRQEQLVITRSLFEIAAEESKGTVQFAAHGKAVAPATSSLTTGRWSQLRSVVHMALAASLLIMLSGFGFMLYQNARLKQQLAGAQNQHSQVLQQVQGLQETTAQKELETEGLVAALENEKKEREKLQQMANATPNYPGSDAARPSTGDNTESYLDKLVIVQLIPTLMGRDEKGAIQTIAIPAKAKSVVLSLGLERLGFLKYRASVVTVDKADVWSGDVTLRRTKSSKANKTTKPVVEVSIPARIFKDGKYILKVTGYDSDNNSESVGTSEFVIKRN